MHAIRPIAALATVFLMQLGLQAVAAPSTYVLEPEASVVGFETDFGQDHITGTMPITQADLTLDFNNVVGSSIAVTLDASGASASFPLAAEAMKGKSVLDAGAHPQIRFQSTSVKNPGDGAQVAGNLTLRGVTRPVVLAAQIWRQQGSAADDLSHLTIRLTGTVHRADYGATGFSDMVSDEVRLDILARIVRVD